ALPVVSWSCVPRSGSPKQLACHPSHEYSIVRRLGEPRAGRSVSAIEADDHETETGRYARRRRSAPGSAVRFLWRASATAPAPGDRSVAEGREVDPDQLRAEDVGQMVETLAVRKLRIVRALYVHIVCQNEHT